MMRTLIAVMALCLACTTPPAAGSTPRPDTASTPTALRRPVDTPPPAPAVTDTVDTAVAAGGAWYEKYHPAPRDTLDSTTYDGWKQFELNCSRCHGEYAVGTSFAPALVQSLKKGGTIPTEQVFIATVCAGRPDKGMPSWCTLGLAMSTIQEIYQYVKGRADGQIAIGRPGLRE